MLTFLALLAAALTSVVVAAPASAHAELVSSVPADGATVATAPRTLLLRLSESVELNATKISITDTLGHDIQVSSVALRKKAGAGTEAPTTLAVALPPLSVGQYRVSWTTLSSDDLHVTAGVLVFGVGEKVESASRAAPEPRADLTEATVRWTGLVGLGTTLGALLLLLLLRPRRTHRHLHEGVSRRLLRTTVAAASVAVAAGALLPVVQAARAPGAVGPTLRRLLLHESFAAWWWTHQVALVGLLLLAVGLLRRRVAHGPTARQLLVAMVLGVLACGSTVLMGHAGTEPSAHVGRVLLETLHVLAALVWTGAVVASAVTLTRRVPGEPGLPSLRLAVLQRFGVIAAVCLAAAVGTGLVLAGARVTTPDALVHAAYGRVLLVKVAVVAVVAGLGLVNTLLLRPGLLPARGRPTSPARLTGRTVAAEAAVVVILLAVTAVLAASAPATGERWQPVDRGAGLSSAQVGDLVETMRVQPDRPGNNFVTLEVFDTRRPSPGPVRSVQVRLTGPEGARIERVATISGDGSWIVPGVDLAPGAWTARVSARRDGLPVTTARHHWTVPDPQARNVSGTWAQNLSSWTGPAALVAVLSILLVAGLLFSPWRRLLRRPARGRSRTPSAVAADGVEPAEASPPVPSGGRG